MIDLLNQFSPLQIILFIILLAIAFKKVSDFLDWFQAKVSKRDKIKEEESEKNKEYIQLKDSINEIMVFIKTLSNKVDLLTASDKDAIKAFITREHHYFCYQKGWIDDYSLDCLERRYQHYVEEEGNSFVGQLMEEIRALPRQEPKEDKGA